jgi:four helix bundle protein
MRGFKDLLAYTKAFDVLMQIFEVSKNFPKEETYSLADQIRRSSRSVCANLAESYRKRVYIKHFLSKVTDAQMENSETEVWLDFAVACKYISKEKYNELLALNDEVGKLLHHIFNNPKNYGAEV